MKDYFFMKRPIIQVCLIFLLFILSFQTIAQPVLTLKQAIKSAFANRKNIEAGRQDVTIRKLQTEALLKKYWPQVSIEYNYQYNPILQTSILPIGIFNPAYPIDETKSIQFGTKWSQAAGLTLNQPLLDATIASQKNEAGLQEKISAASQAQSEYALSYDVAQAYADIWLQQTEVKTAAADTSRTWISYQLQEDKFKAKRLLKSDLNKAIINHNNSVQKLKDAVSQLVENKVYLLYLIGYSDIADADVLIDTGFTVNNDMISQTLQPGTDSIPELQQLLLEQKLSALQVQSEKSKYMPAVSIKGFLGANQYTNQFNPIEANTWFGYSYVGLDVKLPLLLGEDKQNKIQQLKLQASQFYEEREDKSALYSKDAITARIKANRVTTPLVPLL